MENFCIRIAGLNTLDIVEAEGKSTAGMGMLI